MNVSQQLMQINNSADKLITSIENESWDDAMQLSQQWDAKIHDLVRNLSAEQFIAVKDQIENLAAQNLSIKKRLIESRAKVLTKLQENNSSRAAIQLYNNAA